MHGLARQMAQRRQRSLAAAREITGRGDEALTMRELARASREQRRLGVPASAPRTRAERGRRHEAGRRRRA